jgi:hypothetical protein
MKQQPNLARLVVFTPMPPRPNGIADYSYELLAGLAREFDCTVVVEDGTGNSLAPPGVTVISETEYPCTTAALPHLSISTSWETTTTTFIFYRTCRCTRVSWCFMI